MLLDRPAVLERRNAKLPPLPPPHFYHEQIDGRDSKDIDHVCDEIADATRTALLNPAVLLKSTRTGIPARMSAKPTPTTAEKAIENSAMENSRTSSRPLQICEKSRAHIHTGDGCAAQ
jgi:hypothetical protein